MNETTHIFAHVPIHIWESTKRLADSQTELVNNQDNYIHSRIKEVLNALADHLEKKTLGHFTPKQMAELIRDCSDSIVMDIILDFSKLHNKPQTPA